MPFVRGVFVLVWEGLVCLPMLWNNCVNIPNYRRDASPAGGMVLSNRNLSASDSQSSQDHVSGSPGSVRYGVYSISHTVSNDQECNVLLDAANVVTDHSEVNTAVVICKDPFQFGFMDSSDVCYDTLMRRAYGCFPSQLPSVDLDSDWRSRWKQVIYHSGSHYILPSGPVG